MKTLLNVDILLSAYSQGLFPMAEEDGNIYFHNPDPRSIIPLENPKIPRSLTQFLKKHEYTYTIDKAFDEVIRGCADREETWINDEIYYLYSELHQLGFVHSIETWENGELIGGLYGVAIGGAFFGESMFSKKTNASKAAFFYLIKLLKANGFLLLDSQYINDFTESLGAIEISKSAFMKILNVAIKKECNLTAI